MWPLVVVDRWSFFRGVLELKLLGRDLEWSLLTGGVVNTGLTVMLKMY